MCLGLYFGVFVLAATHVLCGSARWWVTLWVCHCPSVVGLVPSLYGWLPADCAPGGLPAAEHNVALSTPL